jgi:hypothetical protein
MQYSRLFAAVSGALSLAVDQCSVLRIAFSREHVSKTFDCITRSNCVYNTAFLLFLSLTLTEQGLHVFAFSCGLVAPESECPSTLRKTSQCLS